MTGDIKIDQTILSIIEKKTGEVKVGYFDFPADDSHHPYLNFGPCDAMKERRVALVREGEHHASTLFLILRREGGNIGYIQVDHFLAYFVETLSFEQLKAVASKDTPS